MFIVLLVTGIALLAGLLEHLPLVTLFAFRFRMLAQQWKIGLVMVETGNFLPRLFRMATSAIAAQTVLVLVIFDMARVALLTGFNQIRIDRDVATDTLDVRVFAIQVIFGVFVVTKNRRFPFLGRMATFTLLTVQPFVPFVVVIFLMTTKTRQWCVFVSIVAMAFHTFGVSVFSG